MYIKSNWGAEEVLAQGVLTCALLLPTPSAGGRRWNWEPRWTRVDSPEPVLNPCGADTLTAVRDELGFVLPGETPTASHGGQHQNRSHCRAGAGDSNPRFSLDAAGRGSLSGRCWLVDSLASQPDLPHNRAKRTELNVSGHRPGGFCRQTRRLVSVEGIHPGRSHRRNFSGWFRAGWICVEKRRGSEEWPAAARGCELLTVAEQPQTNPSMHCKVGTLWCGCRICLDIWSENVV